MPPAKSLQVNYETLAPTYNQRFEFETDRKRAAPLLQLVSQIPRPRVLEVGCGTGFWLNNLASNVVFTCGLDLSMGMLRSAKSRKGPLYLAQGTAGKLPYQNHTFDLVYCMNAIHHFDAPEVFIIEAQRILKPGGSLAVIGMEPHARRDHWYIYDYFEGTFESDLKRFPTWKTVSSWMADAGFQNPQLQNFEEFNDPKTGAAVFDDPFLQKNQSSQLALLSDQAYAAGLQRIQVALDTAAANRETLIFKVHIVVEMLVGKKPRD